MRVIKVTIPNGDAGTRATVRWMKRLASEGRLSPIVRDYALRIARGIPGRDGTSQALAIRRWLASNIEFRRDPYGAELLYTPARLLRILTKQGPPLYIDCDDVAILAAALGGAVGLRSRFQVVGFLSPSAPYRHVWADLSSPSRGARWVDMDVTRQAQPTAAQGAISRRWLVPV
jgi:hypothetical protein